MLTLMVTVHWQLYHASIATLGANLRYILRMNVSIELFVIVNRKLGRQSNLKIIKRNYNLLQQLFKLVRYENEGGTGSSERIS